MPPKPITTKGGSQVPSPSASSAIPRALSFSSMGSISSDIRKDLQAPTLQRTVGNQEPLQRPSSIMGPPQTLPPAQQGKSDVQMRFEEICFKSPVPRSITQIYNNPQCNSLNSQTTPSLSPPTQRSHSSFLSNTFPPPVKYPYKSMVQPITPPVHPIQRQQPIDYWGNGTQSLQGSTGVITNTFLGLKKASASAAGTARIGANSGRGRSSYTYYPVENLEPNGKKDIETVETEVHQVALQGISQSGQKSAPILPTATISNTTSPHTAGKNTITSGWKRRTSPVLSINAPTASIAPACYSPAITLSPGTDKMTKKQQEDKTEKPKDKIEERDVVGFGWSGTKRRRVSRTQANTSQVAETENTLKAAITPIMEQSQMGPQKKQKRRAHHEDFSNKNENEMEYWKKEQNITVKSESRLTRTEKAPVDPTTLQIPSAEEVDIPESDEFAGRRKHDGSSPENDEGVGEDEDQEKIAEQGELEQEQEGQEGQEGQAVMVESSRRDTTKRHSGGTFTSQQPAKRTRYSLLNNKNFWEAHDITNSPHNKESPLPSWVKNLRKQHSKPMPPLKLPKSLAKDAPFDPPPPISTSKKSTVTNTTPAKPLPMVTAKSEPSLKATKNKLEPETARETSVVGRRSSCRATIAPRSWWIVGAVPSAVLVSKTEETERSCKINNKEGEEMEIHPRNSKPPRKGKSGERKEEDEENPQPAKQNSRSNNDELHTTGNFQKSKPNPPPQTSIISRSMSRGRTTIRGTRRKAYNSPSPSIARETPPPRPLSSSPPTDRATKRIRILRRQDCVDEELDVNIENEVEEQLRKEREQQEIKIRGLDSPSSRTPKSVNNASGKMNGKAKTRKNDLKNQKLPKALVGKIHSPPSPCKTRSTMIGGETSIVGYNGRERRKTKYEVEHADYEFSD